MILPVHPGRCVTFRLPGRPVEIGSPGRGAGGSPGGGSGRGTGGMPVPGNGSSGSVTGGGPGLGSGGNTAMVTPFSIPCSFPFVSPA
jgi:hypothetical protein